MLSAQFMMLQAVKDEYYNIYSDGLLLFIVIWEVCVLRVVPNHCFLWFIDNRQDFTLSDINCFFFLRFHFVSHEVFVSTEWESGDLIKEDADEKAKSHRTWASTTHCPRYTSCATRTSSASTTAICRRTRCSFQYTATAYWSNTTTNTFPSSDRLVEKKKRKVDLC